MKTKLNLSKTLIIFFILIGGWVNAQYGTELKIDNKNTFINTINNIRNARVKAINDKQEHMLLRYNKGGGNYTYFQMRVRDFYIIGYATATGREQPNIIPYTDAQTRYPAVLPTINGVPGIKDAFQNPGIARSVHTIALIFAESVRSDTLRNYVGRNFTSTMIQYDPVRPVVTNWAQISAFFKIETTTNKFRPLKDSDYLGYYNATGKPQDLGNALRFLGILKAFKNLSTKKAEINNLNIVNESGRSYIIVGDTNDDITVKIFSLSGSKVFHKSLNKNSKTLINKVIKNGIYIINAENKTFNMSKKVLIGN